MFEYLTLGLLLGLAAGSAPGPLLALVIGATLRHGAGAGIRVALAPLLTDAPLVLITLFVLARLARFEPIIGAISLCGAVFLLVIGVDSLRARAGSAAAAGAPPAALTGGLLANLLSPHPYLFWLSVGGPLMLRAAQQGWAAPLAFAIGFYAALVGVKVLVALLVARSRARLDGRAHRILSRLLGLALCALGIGLARDGLVLMGWP